MWCADEQHKGGINFENFGHGFGRYVVNISKHGGNFNLVKLGNVILIYLLHCAFVPAHEVRGGWWIRPSCEFSVTLTNNFCSLWERKDNWVREREI